MKFKLDMKQIAVWEGFTSARPSCNTEYLKPRAVLGQRGTRSGSRPPGARPFTLYMYGIRLFNLYIIFTLYPAFQEVPNVASMTRNRTKDEPDEDRNNYYLFMTQYPQK